MTLMQVLADLTRRARLGNVGAGAEAHCSVGIRQSLYFVHAGMVLLETWNLERLELRLLLL